jgi:epoxyqueuosine reductase
MLTRENIIEESRRLGFGDVGFTNAEPFTSHLDYLRNHQDEYGWVERVGIALVDGTNPKTALLFPIV